MILRPQRYRTLKGFILGILLCVVLLGAAIVLFGSERTWITLSEKSEIEAKAIEAYLEANPTGIVYVASKALKSGTVISDSDLMPAEIRSIYIPEDAVVDLGQAIGKVLRCDVTTSTAVTHSLLYDQGNYPDDLRLMEYTVINLPQKLEPRQYIDIRIMFPNGMDYIVLSKKQVTDLEKPIDNQPGILWIQANEEEILRMSSAIVDASIVDNAYLYALPYVAPDIQKEAIITYPTNSEVMNLILQDPNIVTKAITELEMRNRRMLEEKINEDRENFGLRRVYGKDTTVITPTAPTPPPANDAAPAQNAQDSGNEQTYVAGDLDGRL
jgi:hypothetical protein